MYDLAKTIDSTVTTDESSYFPVVSETYLGQRQTEQFQSSTTIGKTWGSLYRSARDANNNPIRSAEKIPNTVGSSTRIDGEAVIVSNNPNAEMPRTSAPANVNYGRYYNWYAATAESGKYTTAGTNASDSVCPSGWQIPRPNSGNRSWQNLMTAYNYTLNNQESLDGMEHMPISMVTSGLYEWTNGTFSFEGAGGRYWSSYAEANNSSNALLFFMHHRNGGEVGPSQGIGSVKVLGFTVRCVKK